MSTKATTAATAIALSVGMLLGLVGPTPAGAAEAGSDRAVPTCTPSGAPRVVGSDRTSITVTVPKCATPTGVTGYRIVASTRTGTTTVAQVTASTTAAYATVTGLTSGTIYRFRAQAVGSTGSGPLTGFSALALPPFPTLDAFTDQQWRDFVGRPPTSSERLTWLDGLAKGTLTPVAAIDQVHSSTYWQRQSPVIRLYQAYFLRLPDLSGLTFWAERSRRGTSISTISQSFAASAEFELRYGSLNNKQFVDLIYTNVLGRLPDTAGSTYWTNELTSGRRTRGSVMIGFSESIENRTKQQGLVNVINLFTGMLRRLPTSAEITTWRPRTRPEIITFLLGTQAYAERVRLLPPEPIVASISTGGSFHSCAVITDATVRCWGNNFDGELGRGNYTSSRVPVAVIGVSGVRQVVTGRLHTCALRTNGTVACWGNNDAGQVGDGTTTRRPSPVTVSGLSGVVELDSRGMHVCARLSNGRVSCWGASNSSELGHVSNDPRRPSVVPGLSGVVDISTGFGHTCAVINDGTLRCWGENDSNETGISGASEIRTPTMVPGLTGVATVATGFNHTCVTLRSGGMRCWGENDFGQLGNGTKGILPVPTPVVVSGITNATSASAGSTHTCARLVTGALRCWGRNKGQLGDGSLTDRLTPVAVAGILDAVVLTVGATTGCARLASGQARCWGDNSSGQIGDGTGTTRNSPVIVTGAQ